jgi:dCMP deaminase
MPYNNWDKKFQDVTKLVASWSKDRSTKCGTVIVGRNNEILSTGYNGFPVGVNDDIESRHDRPEKYFYTEHGERNAIYHAARNGHSLENSILYTNWFPCSDCARAIIQSGINEVHCDIPTFEHPTYGLSFAHAFIMFMEAEVIMNIEGNYIDRLYKYDLDSTLPPIERVQKLLGRIAAYREMSMVSTQSGE